MLDFFERFARMEPRWQVAMMLALLIWVGTPFAVVYTIKRGVRMFRAAAPGRRWLALVAWALGSGAIWMAVGLVFVLAFTVIQRMR